jgi:transcriptional regulator with XRE-family HTH domain
MSQGDLARASDIAATQLSRYETGRALPRKLAVHRLANALAVNWRWLDLGEGEIGEYGATEGAGFSIWVDAELRKRITSYAYYNGMTIEEAVADIFDSPLSVYGDEDLPKTPEEKEKLKLMLRATSQKARVKVLAQKLVVMPADPPQPNLPRISEVVTHTRPTKDGAATKVTTEVVKEYKVRHRDERNSKGADRQIPVAVIKKRVFVKRDDEPKS